MRARILLYVVIAASCCGLLRSQEFDVSRGPHWLLSLEGSWRFHAGDDLRWAQPGLDDSNWSLLRSDHDWSTQGFDRYSGMGWYRIHVKLPPDAGQVSLLLPHIFTSYEVYAHGKLAARFGAMPPRPHAYSTHAAQLYTLPLQDTHSRDLVIALRVWQWAAWSRYFGGGPSEPGAFIGDSSSIAQQHALSRAALHWEDSGVLLSALLQSIGALVALCLFFRRRSEREYLWFAAILAFSALAGWTWYSYRYVVWPVWLANQLRDLSIVCGISVAQFAFFTELFKPRRTPVYWFVLACVLSPLCALPVDTGDRIGVLPWNLWTSLAIVPLHVWIVWLLAIRARHNYLDARVLLVPVLLQSIATLLQRAAIVTYVLDWQHRWGFQVPLLNRPFPITVTQAGDLLFLAAVLVILVRRFTRSRTEEERYASEFDAARSVQQYLIPKQLPDLPGFDIHCEYRPALEVGGDFFQIVPHARDGSSMVVIGDVAGKGMHAGMLAALIVGAVRTAAEFTSDPAHVLSLLNERLENRGNATCLVLRIDPSGSISSANAGHIPPYLNGKELAMEGALPLGSLRNANYPVTQWSLDPGDSLLLISDGVIEAQDHKGNLFGFDRLQALLGSQPSAAAVAAAAEAFGQQDDITVLSVRRRAIPAHGEELEHIASPAASVR